jgi:GTPase involved in cell partitioning and DNA repair
LAYAALIANPSAGKSSGMSLIKNALIDIEKYKKFVK